MELQAGISLELNERLVGTTQKVLVDRAEDGAWIGRTQYDSPDVDNEVRIAFQDDLHLRIGDFVMTRITGASEFDLDAEVIA